MPSVKLAVFHHLFLVQLVYNLLHVKHLNDAVDAFVVVVALEVNIVVYYFQEIVNKKILMLRKNCY